MKHIQSLLVALCLLVGLNANAAKQRKVTAVNEVQFAAALASNTIIEIPEGTKLNLTRVLAGLSQSSYYTLEERKLTGVFGGGMHDGLELVLSGLENLTIQGLGDTQALIEVEPRYANVLRFLNCSNIKLRNLMVGHTKDHPGYCEGGVLYFANTNDIEVEGCDLYGCGIEGITTDGVNNLTVSNTVIHDCTYSIMTLNGAHNVVFEGCTFQNCREFGMVNTDDICENVLFKACTFNNNNGTLFELRSGITMQNCLINHDGNRIGNSDRVTHENCVWNLK